MGTGVCCIDLCRGSLVSVVPTHLKKLAPCREEGGVQVDRRAGRGDWGSCAYSIYRVLVTHIGQFCRRVMRDRAGCAKFCLLLFAEYSACRPQAFHTSQL